MGGEQAASVLATVHRDADKWTPEQAEAFKQPIRDDYEARRQPLARHRAAVGRRHHRPGADPRRARPRLRRNAERADPRSAAVRRVQDVRMSYAAFERLPLPCRDCQHWRLPRAGPFTAVACDRERFAAHRQMRGRDRVLRPFSSLHSSAWVNRTTPSASGRCGAATFGWGLLCFIVIAVTFCRDPVRLRAFRLAPRQSDVDGARLEALADHPPDRGDCSYC